MYSRAVNGPWLGGAAASGPGAAAAAAGAAGAQSAIDTANLNMANTVTAQSYSEFNNIGNYVAKMQAELDKQLFDAMEVNFKVSSEKTLTRPYVVIIARYHDKDTNPPKVQELDFRQSPAPDRWQATEGAPGSGRIPSGFRDG